MIAAPGRDKEICIAIVVIIAGANAFSPATRAQSHFVGDVAKVIVSLVVIHAVCAAHTGKNEQVKESVIVVVDKGDPAAGCFNDVMLRSCSPVWKNLRQPCF